MQQQQIKIIGTTHKEVNTFIDCPSRIRHKSITIVGWPNPHNRLALVRPIDFQDMVTPRFPLSHTILTQKADRKTLKHCQKYGKLLKENKEHYMCIEGTPPKNKKKMKKNKE